VNTIPKIIFASTLALSAFAPAFAYEGDEDTVLNPNTHASTSGPLAQHIVGKRVHASHAMDAGAYAPADAPADPSYKYFHDRGDIGSQS
jgi:hypothetical protein